MKVAIFPGDEKGVGWYRMRYPARAARREGLEVELLDGLPLVRAIRRADMRMVIAPGEIDADVLVFQRISNPEIIALIPALQARGHAVVIDVDDDLSALDHRNRARNPQEDPRKVARACACADLITVSTPALARRYGAHGRVRILPNCVPAALLDMPRDSDGLTVGWAGWTGTHPGDLAVTGGGVGEAIRDTGARFHHIGPVEGVREQLRLQEEPTATGGLAMEDYHQALGALDVGIAPLRDTAFNRGKSALKPLEMTARGAAVVMSPVAEYQALAQEGIGLLATERSRHWRARVRELISDPALRREVVARGQRIVSEHHTYEGQGWRWSEAWEQARANHRHRHPQAAAA